MLYYILAGVAVFLLVIFFIMALVFRRVVDTNKVHIVQTRGATISYGTGQKNGNVYYQWPKSWPIIGLTYKELPVSNFALNLNDYKAYDKDRVPFELDVTAFLRIKDTNTAAERVASYDELHDHLKNILQGAVRKILAGHTINEIMTARATFGEQFTTEVADDLANWGIEPVKSMELMDIRDVEGSHVIANIMAKQISVIDMESRTEVAKNRQAAETAEIAAQQAVDISRQNAEQAVGERTAAKEKAVGIAREQSAQEVKAQQAITSQKQIDVQRVEEVGAAEITKAKEVVAAEQDKQTTVLKAEGALEATKLAAQGVEAEGQAKAAAEKAMQMAPVEAQIALAKEIGANENYQGYLVSVEQIKALTSVGGKQAEALAKAEIKIIATAGNALGGATNAMNIMSPGGGTGLASMLEGFAQMPEGRAILDAVAKNLSGGKKGPVAVPDPLPAAASGK